MRIVLVTGTVGVGKSTTGYAVAERAASQGRSGAFLDVDELSRLWPARAADPFNTDLILRNLAPLVGNYADAGAELLVPGHAPTTVTDEPLTERCVRTGLLACKAISWHRQSLADPQLRFARPLRVVAALCATDRRVRARRDPWYVQLGPFGASASMTA